MLYYPIAVLLLPMIVTLLSVHGQHSVTDKPENLKQSLEANRNSFLQLTRDNLIPSMSENNDIATTILKIFGINSESEVLEAQFTRTTNLPNSSRNEVKVADRGVCPFDTDPLILSGEYIYCKPQTISECPTGFICDFSVLLGRSICCQDMRNQPIINIKVKIPTNATAIPFLTTLPWRQERIRTHQYLWPSTVANRQSPWYIRDRTQWNGTAHNLLPSKAITTPTTPLLESHELSTASTIDVNGKKISAEEYNTTNKITATTEKEEILRRDTSELGITSTKTSQTTTFSSTLLLPADNTTFVSLIQVGNIKKLTDRQILIIGTITLINDHGYRILVDTGSAADTELLLQGLSKEMITVDEIAVVVITSGHPSYTGNLNLFPLKPILFHSMEYMEQHAAISELKDRPYRKLTENIEVWKTPGRTQQGLSVLIYDVKGYGTMAIVGDLIPTENYIFNKTDSNEDFDGGVWDSLIRRQNSNLIICLADWIIPGHGQPFKVLPNYRQRAGCTRLLARRKKFGKM
ncbi:Uncharacterized protein ACO02O_10998 [Dirofilaria immitis]